MTARTRPGLTVTAAVMLAAFLLHSYASSASSEAESASASRLAEQAAQYKAEAPKTIVELQQFRRSESIRAGGSGDRRGTATLINLNPTIGAWFLLSLKWENQGGSATYHLENPGPRRQTIGLDPHGIQISVAGRATFCDLWSEGPMSALQRATSSGLPYAPLCDGHLYLRNRVSGSGTSLERITDFLRDHVWGGEKIIGFVRKEFYRNRFIEKPVPSAPSAPLAGEVAPPDWPRAASLRRPDGDQPIVPEHLGVDVGQPGGGLFPGRWYPVSGLAGIYVSLVQASTIAPEILNSYRNVVNNLDPVEANAVVYLVAFDLAAFDLGFAVGTDHPRVGWSERVLGGMRDNRLPGPDGIDTIAPLVPNGMIMPALGPRTVATFTGGFKRQHGAFRYGPFAERNHGSHYGFVEQGAVLSKLMPGLSTLYVLDDGAVDMKTWTEQDDALLSRVKHARQNGVPLIEYDPATDASAPGSLVGRWGPGNWSGSANEDLRSLRAGACLQQTPKSRFLVYGYFSAATPSAMARVFQAYGCRYAMHLDMNALEHTYLAFYLRRGNEIVVQHLIQGMAEVDKTSGGRLVPRFLGFADDRDFFYLVRRE
jgi:hypothetical protein